MVQDVDPPPDYLRAMRRTIFLLALVLLAVGCKKAKPATYKYSVYVPSSGPVEGLEIDGKALKAASSTPQGASFEITLPASEYLVEKALTVKLATTCGTSSFSAKADVGLTKADTRSSEDDERKNILLGYLTANATFTGPTEARIYVDRDGAPSATVQIGTTTLDPKFDVSVIPLGVCPASDEIKIAGVASGSLHFKPKAEKDPPPMAFIDAAGGHCYELAEHVYVDKTWDPTHLEGGKVLRLEGQRGYLAHIDDFLKPSPRELTTKDALSSRYEVRRCAPKPKTSTPPKRR